LRSIFRDFSADFFDILKYPLEDWDKGWSEYEGKHPRIIEEYRCQNSLSNNMATELLKKIGRRRYDRVYIKWMEKNRELKNKIIYSIRHCDYDFELKKEDFVVYFMPFLKLKKYLFIPTSKGHVLALDMLFYYEKDEFDNLPDDIVNAMKDFRIFSKYNIEKKTPPEEKIKRYDHLYEKILNDIKNTDDIDIMNRSIVNNISRYIDYCDWTGIYRGNDDGVLTLDYYIGEPTEHVNIPYGKGICGQSAKTNLTFLIDDVTTQDNYLSCGSNVKSEIVIPIKSPDGGFLEQLDIDSHSINTFDEIDKKYLEKICSLANR
jgi:GAF domain-containing protein